MTESQTHYSAAVMLASGAFGATRRGRVRRPALVKDPEPRGRRARLVFAMQCDTRAGGSRHHVARSATCAKARSTDNEACALIMQALHSHSSSDRRSGAPVGSGGGPVPWSERSAGVPGYAIERPCVVRDSSSLIQNGWYERAENSRGGTALCYATG